MVLIAWAADPEAGGGAVERVANNPSGQMHTADGTPRRVGLIAA
jgi:hypothetical protein